MQYVKVTFNSGDTRRFDDSKVEYVEGFAVIVDKYGATTSLPTTEIKEIYRSPPPRSSW